jgi:hypothetical protein
MNRRSFLSFLAPLPILPLLPMLKLTRTTNPMEFQEGQTVVCVNSDPHLIPGRVWSRSEPAPIRGKIYTVEDGFKVSNGSYWVTLKELTNPGHLCVFPNWRFRPITS